MNVLDARAMVDGQIRLRAALGLSTDTTKWRFERSAMQSILRSIVEVPTRDDCVELVTECLRLLE